MPKILQKYNNEIEIGNNKASCHKFLHAQLAPFSIFFILFLSRKKSETEKGSNVDADFIIHVSMCLLCSKHMKYSVFPSYYHRMNVQCIALFLEWILLPSFPAWFILHSFTFWYITRYFHVNFSRGKNAFVLNTSSRLSVWQA